jgi:hypothetical protein
MFKKYGTKALKCVTSYNKYSIKQFIGILKDNRANALRWRISLSVLVISKLHESKLLNFVYKSEWRREGLSKDAVEA